MSDDDAARVERAVREALEKIRPGAAGLDRKADLALHAGLDSVEVMDLIMEVEDALDVSIPVETLADAGTIDGLCAGILRLGGGKT
jgi:acyl carrier protein